MTLKNNRTHLLCYFKLCASFHSHLSIQTWVTVRKRLSWVLISMTLTFDSWPWPFAWISLLSWWEHSDKGVTDGRTERSVLKAAWSQLKTAKIPCRELLRLETVWEVIWKQGFKLIYWSGHEGGACLVTWFCYHLIAKPNNKAGAPSLPDPYVVPQKLYLMNSNHVVIYFWDCVI